MYWNARLRLHQVLCVLYCNKALSIPPATQASLSSISLSSRSRKGIRDREEGKKGGGWGERVSLFSAFALFSILVPRTSWRPEYEDQEALGTQMILGIPVISFLIAARAILLIAVTCSCLSVNDYKSSNLLLNRK